MCARDDSFTLVEAKKRREENGDWEEVENLLGYCIFIAVQHALLLQKDDEA